MSLSSKLESLSTRFKNLLHAPPESAPQLAGPPELVRGANVAQQWRATANSRLLELRAEAPAQDDSTNPLRAYFDGIQEGPGVWKWLHYFEMYHRHLQKYVGRPVTVVEVGVSSGGSMPMWEGLPGAWGGHPSRMQGV